MTYNAREISAYQGEPVELYEFMNGSAAWRFTSFDEPISYDGHTYTPSPIQRSSIGDTQELNKLNVRLTVPADNPLAEMYQSYPPTAITTVSVFRYHSQDTEVTVEWLGRVVNAENLGPTTELLCEPDTTSIRRLGLRRFYQRECPHILYGEDCRVTKEEHVTNATVYSHEGLTVHLNEKLKIDLFAGGMVAWESSAGTQYRSITSNAEKSVQVNFPLMPDDDKFGRGLPAGTRIKIYPGCRHTLTDCINRYGNLANYGGFPFTPLTNPFEMTTLY